MRFMLDDDEPLSGFGGTPKFSPRQVNLDNAPDSPGPEPPTAPPALDGFTGGEITFNPTDPGVKGNPAGFPGGFPGGDPVSPTFDGSPAFSPVTDPPPDFGAESVRASNTAGFDPAYAQNLAVFGAGNFVRPGGSLNVDPFAASPFEGYGTPVGGGNSPLFGGPQTLLEDAMSKTTAAPPAPAPPAAEPAAPDPNQSYIDAVGAMDAQSALRAFAGDPRISPNAQTTQLWESQGIPLIYLRTADGYTLALRADSPAGGAAGPTPLSGFNGGDFNGFGGGGGGYDGGGLNRMLEM
jgi:hypothetical protein